QIDHDNAWNIGTVKIDGGAVANNETVRIRGLNAADDTITYTASAADAGTLVIANGAVSTTYDLVAVNHLSVDGQGNTAAGDTLTIATANAVVVPGSVPGSGVVYPVDAVGAALLPLTYQHVENVSVASGAASTVVVQGTAEDDVITLTTAGLVRITNL